MAVRSPFPPRSRCDIVTISGRWWAASDKDR
jgi:hypothetical protein